MLHYVVYSLAASNEAKETRLEVEAESSADGLARPRQRLESFQDRKSIVFNDIPNPKTE